MGKVFFSDETKIILFKSDRRVLLWRKQDEGLYIKDCVKTIKHGGKSLMVWVCMSSKGVRDLVFIKDNLDSILYKRI